MWKRGLLIVGNGKGSVRDLRPLSYMESIGRGDFFTVLREEDAADGWPDERPDVVMIAPGCSSPSPLIRECTERDVRFMIIGCPYLDEEADSLLKRYRASGGRALGAGSQGFLSWEDGLALCWSSAVKLPGPQSPRSHVTLIAQGGTVPFSLYAMSVESGVHFRRVISLGSCDDHDEELFRCMEETISDDDVTLLILCIESLERGREFLELASKAAARGLSVVLLRSGISSSVRQRQKRRHKTAAWTDEVMWESVAGQYGVVLLNDVQQVVDLGKLAGLGLPVKGRRVAILSLSEGLAFLQADQCEAAGLEIASFSRELKEEISSRLPSWVMSDNPVDLSKSNPWRGDLLEDILSLLQKSDECDMILLISGSLTQEHGVQLARAMASSRKKGDKLMACCYLGRKRPMDNMRDIMTDNGIPRFSSPRRIAEAMSGLWGISRRAARISDLYAPAEKPFLDSCPESMSERDAMALVENYGLKTVPHRFCTSVAEVLGAARELRFPLALKVVSPSFASKQAARAVALNLKTEEELRNAYGRISERAHRVSADADIQGVFAQRMVTDGVECMIGIKRDPLFGPVVAVAPGGIYYSLMHDISLRVAPVDMETALDMIKSLKGYILISGEWHGRPLDVEALARQIVILSKLACAEPDIEILDINPIFIRPLGKGAEIADAFAVRRKKMP